MCVCVCVCVLQCARGRGRPFCVRFLGALGLRPTGQRRRPAIGRRPASSTNRRRPASVRPTLIRNGRPRRHTTTSSVVVVVVVVVVAVVVVQQPCRWHRRLDDSTKISIVLRFFLTFSVAIVDQRRFRVLWVAVGEAKAADRLLRRR